ncbi:MAG: NAD(P)H-dependent oxidoreductase subunit E, partial [Dehalococcoidia bacterium]
MNEVETSIAADPSAIDLSWVDEMVAAMGHSPEALVPILQAVQQQYRYLPEQALRRVCEITDITPAQMAGVATFYTQFRHRPAGQHVISVCHGTACHVKGAELTTEALRRHLGLAEDEDTDAEGVFTVQQVACLGCCTLAPVMQIDGVTYGHMTPDTVPQALRDFLELQMLRAIPSRQQPSRVAADGLGEIRIGIGSCCVAGGSQEVRTGLEEAVRKLHAAAVIKPVGCVGMCHQTPLVEVIVPGKPPLLYAKMLPTDAEAII